MSISSQDWRKLRDPILGLGAALVFVGLLISFADQYRQKNEIALQTQQNLLNQARQKYQSSGLEKETITQYLPIYNDLLASGFIGEERRIEWIESLRQIHAQHKLFSIDYSIGLQEQTTPFIVRDCEITRPIGTEINTKNIVANLKAVCEIDWLTLRDPQLTGAI